MRGDRLKEIRELRQLSQADLAKRVGSHVQQIYRYENGKADPSADVLTSMARALEVSIDYLVGLVSEPNEHLGESELSPMEQRLIWAWRNGQIVEAFKTLATGLEEIDHSSISTGEEAVDSEPLKSVE